jgi:hypothetical protein
MSQRRWGSTKCRKFLERNQISELKQVGQLTERQKRMLADQLESCAGLGEELDPCVTRVLELV